MPNKEDFKQKFIEKGKQVFGNKYDYSLVEYINNKTKVKIICPVHGVFEQTPLNHKNGHGCRECYLNEVMITKEEFLKQASSLHNNKYDYSLVEFTNTKTVIKILCPVHGIFEMQVKSHLEGCGCKYCNGKRIIFNKDDFIKKANLLHNNKYDYSLLKYKYNNEKGIIICPIHGKFKQYLNQHLCGHGCKQCYLDKVKICDYTKTSLLREFNRIHNDRYEYLDLQDITYTPKDNTKIKINCNKHGIFYHTIFRHLKGFGCPHCKKEISGSKRNIFCQEDFIKVSNLIHNSKYDYSLVEYKGINDKVKIICPEHGIFLQKPSIHVNGHGCRKCCKYKGESVIMNNLDKVGIKYEQEKTFDDCRGNKNCLRFDFYLPDLNVLIEFNGRQHYDVVPFKHGVSDLELVQKYDSIKRDYCLKVGIRLIVIRYDENVGDRLRAEKIIP